MQQAEKVLKKLKSIAIRDSVRRQTQRQNHKNNMDKIQLGTTGGTTRQEEMKQAEKKWSGNAPLACKCL